MLRKSVAPPPEQSGYVYEISLQLKLYCFSCIRMASRRPGVFPSLWANLGPTWPEARPRCLKGFHMSGQAPYGFQLEPTVVEGIRTKMMVPDPAAADHVRLMFQMYSEPGTSFGDITRYMHRPVWRCTSFSKARGRQSSMMPPTLPEQ